MDEPRNYALDMAKVFATICILFHHYQQVEEAVTGVSASAVIDFYEGSFNWGQMVEAFFLVSGVCMLAYITKIKNGLTFYQYYVRRAGRLLPLMAVSGVVYAVLQLLFDKVYRMAFFGKDPSLFGIVLQAFGVQKGWGFSSPFLNNPTWYCSVLLLCYVIFYAIVYWSHRLQVSPFYGFVFMILLGCGIQTYGIDLPFLNGATCRGFYAFFAGIVLAKLMPMIQKWRWSAAWAVLVIVIFALAYKMRDGQLEYMPFLLTFVLYPAILIVLQAFPLHYISALPFWGKWARITYSVFIWHLPFYMLVYTVLPVLGQSPLLAVSVRAMLLCAVVLQGVGWLSYRYLECPLNRKVQNWLLSLDPAKVVQGTR